MAVAEQDSARVVQGALPVPARRLPARGHPRPSTAGKSVIVSAPTGAGKTLVAEFAIHAALDAGRRIAYTTPLKALSNQKFADFTRAYGEEQVGILTGDVKVNPRAPRAGDDDRDPPQHALRRRARRPRATSCSTSATTWATRGAARCGRRSSSTRPQDVQLVGAVRHRGQRQGDRRLDLARAPAHRGRSPPAPAGAAALLGRRPRRRDPRLRRACAAGTRARGRRRARRRPRRPRRAGTRGAWSIPPCCIDALEQRGWLPAIYFIFSRAGCERAMEDVLAEGKPLLTREQRREVDEAIARRRGRRRPTIARVAAEPDHLPGAAASAWRCTTPASCPSVKRLIESLFERGLCKVVFATETMSLGIHMPARERGAAVADQAHRPRLPRAHPQRADPDGGARGPARHRSRGQVRDRARRARRARGHAARRRRRAGADREPVQARLRLGRAPARRPAATWPTHPAHASSPRSASTRT